MTDDRLERRIENLSEEDRVRYESQFEERSEELREELLNNHRSDIDNQLDSDREELNDFNVVVSSFQNRSETEYRFIRTEPFYHKNKKNFDILIANLEKGITVFVEIERTLESGTDAKLEKFRGRKEFVESGGDSDLDVNDYLENVLATQVTATDFVISSQVAPQPRLEAAGERKEMNFCVWNLADFSVTCSIRYFIVKQDKTAPFNGHTEEDLENYLHNVLSGRVPRDDYLEFISSTSKYKKLRYMAVVIVKRIHGKDQETFTFEDWQHLFGEQDLELYNYLDQEKEAIYESFIEYGTDCDVVELVVDHGDKLTNEYRIVSRSSKDTAKLVEELEKKMGRHRMQDEFDKGIQDLKEEILENLSPYEGTTLDEFLD